MSEEAIFHTTGSVFDLLDLPKVEAEELKLKAELLSAAMNALAARKWTQKKAAKELGIHQSRVSELVNGKISLFSVEALIGFLAKLEDGVTLTIEHADHTKQEIRLSRRQIERETVHL